MDVNSTQILIEWVPCEGLDKDCAEKKEIERFIQNYSFWLMIGNNFVDMDDFDNMDGYIKQQPVNVVWSGLSRNALGVKLNEHRVELQDSRVNFMGLSDTKSLSFLNADSGVDVMPDTDFFSNFSI